MTLADLIKPLVWVEHCRRSGNTSAKAVGGEYICERAGDDGHYGVWTPHRDQTDDPLAYFPSLKSAQASAQADYTACVLSALDPAAIARIRADALREAAEVGGQASVDLLLRHDPSASILEKQLVRRAVAAPILALIEKEKDDECPV